MKVFKFGGASVNGVERIKKLAGIVESYSGGPLVIVVSAMGKTTNALESVTEAFYAGDSEQALALFNDIKQQHLATSKNLLTAQYENCIRQLSDFFTEAEWLLHDKPVREYDYYYDQVVCIGELLSTCIVSHYLLEAGITNEWLDVRDLLRTDNNFRDAGIDWPATTRKIKDRIDNNAVYVTQGFIGATEDNESTTLGREGSDYTAAVFANILDAESLTIWKDVEGVMNADPKLFSEASLISELSFTEVIEMAYYGAQVIHPKTIKPLQNKGIPLQVKCFLDPSLPGTSIHKKNSGELPPVIIVKDKQAILHLNSRDFSFVGEEPMMRLYQMFSDSKIRPNLIQTGAISVQVCLDDNPQKIDQLASFAAALFDVQLEKQLNMLTIRHYTDEIVNKLTQGKNIVLTQKTKETLQVVYC